MILALVAMVTMVSCDKDPDPDPVLVEDGLYVKGAGTALTDLDVKGLFAKTRNEVLQETRNSLMETFIAVSGGADGFSLVNVVGGVEETWGPAADFAAIATEDLDGDEPTLGLWRGAYEISETPFAVTEDGLYHVMVDTELGKVAVSKVEWGLIGAATPSGWSGSTALPATFDLNTMSFTLSEVAMSKGDFKYRYSNGWKVILDTIVDLGEGNLGVKVNTNFGGAVDALVPGGDNINNTVTGYYTATMTWTLGEGHVATMTKTGDLPSTDYSSYEMGFVGDGVFASDVVVSWDATWDKKTPTVDGSDYSWSWTGVDLRTAGSFKVRQGDNWDGLVLGFPQVTMAGTSAANFETNGDGNFVPLADGLFDVTLSVDGTTDEFVFTVDPSTK